jgi:catechol 2,3-dioxygenase-like lactoylglutathione lyase family enzyme
MDATAIDHLNLKIPADGLDDAVAFYGDALGFAVENRDLYEAGEKPFVSVRLTPDSVLHLRPTERFTPPSGDDFDHVAVRVDATVDEVRAELVAADVDVDQELTPLGATGEAPAVYVHDPFGYYVELKAEVER